MKYFIILMSLWSWSTAFGVPHSPWAFVEENGKEKCGVVEIKNMPRIRSQDSLPICASMSSATVAQYQVCKSDPKLLANCANLPRENEISPFSTLAWTNTNTGSGVHELQNHTNLTFFNGSGGASDALENARADFIFSSDSCFPLDQFANENGFDADLKIKDIFAKIDEQYAKFAKAKTEGEFCEECEVAKSVNELGLSKSLEDIKTSLKASKKAGKNSRQAMYDLTIGKCKQAITLDQSPKFDKFPKDFAKSKKTMKKEEFQKTYSYSGLVNKIKDVLSQGNPLTFDGVCLEYQGDKCKPGRGHAVVISGYRRVCKKSGACAEDCRDVIKVQNSWGKDWQEKNSDGWVDAKTLLSYVTADPARMENVLAWYH